ncbi:MAG: hypothetical protein R2731_19040 [Nocardioides sp.]
MPTTEDEAPELQRVAGDLSAPDAELPTLATAPQPDWWHRDHPTFVALAGFFTGLVTVSLLPGLFVIAMRHLFSDRVAEETFPFVLLFLLVPAGLMVFPTTRRFGKYLLFGMVVTMLVVAGVGTAVFWLMMRSQT